MSKRKLSPVSGFGGDEVKAVENETPEERDRRRGAEAFKDACEKLGLDGKSYDADDVAKMNAHIKRYLSGEV